ncbi:MAG: hypothetical protein JW881_18290 [Spirochaetales bacterium]|nr:hypothetical protein [Spirochaetales bacterium]
MKNNLTVILDFILNRATEKELFAIKEAIKRRERNAAGPSGKSLSDMAAGMSREIGKQMKVPLEQIRHTVRDMVIRMIKENAPEITDEQLDVLLKEWVGEPERKNQPTGRFPPEMILEMIRQFIAFSINKMPKEEDERLRAAMGDWPERYWQSFPEAVRLLVSRYLKGTLEETVFWKNVFSELGISG